MFTQDLITCTYSYKLNRPKALLLGPSLSNNSTGKCLQCSGFPGTPSYTSCSTCNPSLANLWSVYVYIALYY